MTTATTAPAPPSATGPGARGTATGPTARSVVRRVRGPLAWLVLVALVALGAAALTATRTSRLLDPDTYDGAGGHALATLLRDRGVQVQRVTDAASLPRLATPSTTVFVPHPDLEEALPAAGLADLPGELVVAAPGAALLAQLRAGVDEQGAAAPAVRDAGCDLPAAVDAGSALMGGVTYQPVTGTPVTGCYAAGGAATLVRVPARHLTVLGSADALTNQHLAEQGDAALALGLLGRGDTVLWLVPDLNPPGSAPGDRRSVNSFLPDWVGGALPGVAATVVMLALWRARRFGPVVAEPLPVVVRASEAVEGQGRLYRAARARGRAATALRHGALERLSRRLGLSPSATGTRSAALLEAVGRRTGRSPAAVEGLLYGAAPVDDGALVRLADDLDRLMREVSGT